MDFFGILLLITTLTNGLAAGVFFTFTALIIPGLLDASPEASLKGFQTIDRRLQPTSPTTDWQPLFGSVIFGTSVLLMATFIFGIANLTTTHRVMLGIATLTYNLGFWIPTVRTILPFNNRVRDYAIDKMDAEELGKARAEFEKAWRGWNTVRTAASAFSFVLLLIVLSQS